MVDKLKILYEILYIEMQKFSTTCHLLSDNKQDTILFIFKNILFIFKNENLTAYMGR